MKKVNMQPHCLNSMDCSEFYDGCENCRRTDGVSIEDYDENGVIESVGFLKPKHVYKLFILLKLREGSGAKG